MQRGFPPSPRPPFLLPETLLISGTAGSPAVHLARSAIEKSRTRAGSTAPPGQMRTEKPCFSRKTTGVWKRNALQNHKCSRPPTSPKPYAGMLAPASPRPLCPLYATLHQQKPSSPRTLLPWLHSQPHKNNTPQLCPRITSITLPLAARTRPPSDSECTVPARTPGTQASGKDGPCPSRRLTPSSPDQNNTNFRKVVGGRGGKEGNPL